MYKYIELDVPAYSIYSIRNVKENFIAPADEIADTS